MKQEISDRQLSINAGEDSNFLSSIKFNNIEKYNYIKKVGIDQFNQKQLDLINDVTEMHIDLIHARLGSTFWKQYLTEYFSSNQSFLNQGSDLSYRIRHGSMNMNAFIKWNKIIQIYNKNKQKFYEDN